MASPAAAVTVDTQQSPAPKLDNVLYEKRSVADADPNPVHR